MKNIFLNHFYLFDKYLHVKMKIFILLITHTYIHACAHACTLAHTSIFKIDDKILIFLILQNLYFSYYYIFFIICATLICKSRYFDYNRQFSKRDKCHVAVILIHVRNYTHLFYMLRYLTYATFPLIAAFSARETSEQFSKEKYVIRLLLTRATTNYRGHRPRSNPGSCNDAGANFRGSSTRGYKLFNRSVCGTDTSCRCGRAYVHARMCMRGLAWLCHDSSLQFVQWSKATVGVREHYRR